MFNVAQQWNRCLDAIKANLPAEQFDVWFAPIVAVDYDQKSNRVTLRVPSQFFVEQIEGRYLNLLSATLKKVFGDDAARLHISSTKSMTGHMLGATGAVEAIASILALDTGIIPPTINYRESDPECDLNYTPNEAAKADPTAAISTSLGFGGHNACVAFRKV